VIELTVLKTSSASCRMAILDHPNFWKTLIRVGLCTVAEGWVRNKVGKRCLKSKSNPRFIENVFTFDWLHIVGFSSFGLYVLHVLSSYNSFSFNTYCKRKLHRLNLRENDKMKSDLKVNSVMFLGHIFDCCILHFLLLLTKRNVSILVGNFFNE
jgi:hypothetical protein